MLYWTDMGNQVNCELRNQNTDYFAYTTLDAIYMQLTMFISQFPYGLPVSMCINKQCGDVDNWKAIS